MSLWTQDDSFWNSPTEDKIDSSGPQAKASSSVCPNCGSHAIESLGPSGASVCTDCGILVEENTIVSSVEFAEGAGGASTMVGQFVGQTARMGSRGPYGFSGNSRENTLAGGKRRLQEVGSLMRLAGSLVDAAHRLYAVALDKNFVQGRKRSHVLAACLYTACRQNKTQHMLIDFSDAMQINVYLLGTCFLKFRRLLGFNLEVIDPALYIYRFAAHLNLHAKANLVAMTALRLVARMKRDWIVAGRRPAGICAAALLIASRAHGFDRHHHDVTKILKVCGLTVMTRLKEFENTPTATFTLEQLHPDNLPEQEEEVDPPVFTRNRMREARAKAVAERNLHLLTSGLLDDPTLKGKWASSWRKPKGRTDKQSQYADMYHELESELTRGDTWNNTDKPMLSFTRAEKMVEHCAPPKIATHEAEIAYPLGHNHRPIILPNQATIEELKAPTQKSEDTLNFEEWKAAVPEGAADEVDFLFRNDDEVREREAVFNAQNKEYIETQQQKENDRLIAAAALKEKEEDELAQEEGRRRYLTTTSRSRKKRDRWDPNELTTEEALLEVVRTKNISRKINYDAMSALFDDYGDFSVDLVSGGDNQKEEGMLGEV